MTETFLHRNLRDQQGNEYSLVVNGDPKNTPQSNSIFASDVFAKAVIKCSGAIARPLTRAEAEELDHRILGGYLATAYAQGLSETLPEVGEYPADAQLERITLSMGQSHATDVSPDEMLSAPSTPIDPKLNPLAEKCAGL